MKRTWTYFSDVYSRIGFSGIIFLKSGSFALTVTNYPLSQLFPKTTAFIVIAGQMVFQALLCIPGTFMNTNDIFTPGLQTELEFDI